MGFRENYPQYERKQNMIHLLADTSVIIKWFRFSEDEDYVPQAQRVRDCYLSGEAAISTIELSILEFSNTLKFSKRLSSADAEKALSALLDFGMKILPINPKILRQALKYSFAYNITYYDALFLSACVSNKAKLVTADKIFYNKTNSLSDIVFIANINNILPE